MTVFDHIWTFTNYLSYLKKIGLKAQTSFSILYYISLSYKLFVFLLFNIYNFKLIFESVLIVFLFSFCQALSTECRMNQQRSVFWLVLSQWQLNLLLVIALALRFLLVIFALWHQVPHLLLDSLVQEILHQE